MEEIVNKVANSGILTLDLEELFDSSPKGSIDLADYLFKGLILKEKDFRQAVKEMDWSNYNEKNVAIHCSADAIVPTWAFMLIANKLEPHAKNVFCCKPELLDEKLMQNQVANLDLSQYENQRVVVKGCSNLPVPISAYTHITARLTPLVKSIFYGEPCSTVPIYKRKPK